MKLQVLYEDNHIIAVVKPAGMLTQSDATGDVSLMEEVKKFLKEKYQKPGNVFLGLVHRLDRPVSGIVLFGKTSKGASRLSEQVRAHTLQKIYHALVVGHPRNDRDTLVSYLRKDETRNIVTVFHEPAEGALRAELSYEVVRSDANTSLLKINLKTGRSHQIRAQLSAIGCPIVGDLKYGAREALPDGNIALAATEVRFKLATTDEVQTVSMEIPKWI